MPLFRKRRDIAETFTPDDVISAWGPVTMDEWQEITQLIADRWLSLAASAGEGLQLAGRGALGLDFEEQTSRYLPSSAIPSVTPMTEFWRALQRMCHTYDPKRELVCVIFYVGERFDEDACIHLRIPQGWATPSEAFRHYGVVSAT